MTGRATLLGLAVVAGLTSACRASCNFDLNLPTCASRFTGTRLVAHRLASGLEDRDAVEDALVAARGDAELGTGWRVTRVADELVLGFPEAGAVGRLPPFVAVDGCPADTTRNLGYVEDATLARQPRLRVQVGSCADDEDVLFTGPADFGEQVLPWARDDGGWDLWVSAPLSGLARGGVWHFDEASDREVSRRSHDTAALALEGLAPGDRLGAVLTRCGDLDGDGFDELAISATGWSREGTPELGGAVWIVSPATVGDAVSGEDAASSILWGAAHTGAGAAVHCSDDLDGDGVLDLLIGAPHAGADERGAVYLVSAATLPRSGALAELASLVIEGDEVGGRAGASLTVADLDGDAAPELIVGVPGSSLAGGGTGSVLVFSGADLRAGTPAAVAFTGRPGVAVDGTRSPPRLGTVVTAADLDRDGLPELVAPAWRADRDGRSLHAGEVRIWSGALVSQLLGGAAPEAFTVRGEGPHQEVGHLLVVTDIDNDGVPDVVTAARRQAR